jgi:predicted dehydrogenase
MHRVAIIGCGKIADQHAVEIQRIKDFELAAVCDQEELMAKQLSERFQVKQYCHDVDEMLDRVRPEIVHITTPTQSHFALGKKCLEAGSHVYIEKPFTLDTVEAEALIKLAESKNLKLTAGHNAQFTLAARHMRELVRNGYLGGPPLHMDCYYCYNLGDPSYAKALLGDKNHWVRRMPGKLLQNIISHGISKIAEFIISDNPTVIAHGFTSPVLKSIHEDDIIDEVRVIIHDNNNTTAYFTFSSQLRPVLHQLRLYGPRNALIMDDDNQTVVKIKGNKYKSYLDHFIPPLLYAKQYFSNSLGNMKKFVFKELNMNSGMRYLINSFYQSVTEEKPLPISYREIQLTSRIMDSIFKQVRS